MSKVISSDDLSDLYKIKDRIRDLKSQEDKLFEQALDILKFSKDFESQDNAMLFDYMHNDFSSLLGIFAKFDIVVMNDLPNESE